MGFAIDSDPVLRAALYVTLGATACIILLIGVIAWLRIARAARARWDRRLRRMWEPQIAACALEPPVQLPRVHPLHRPVFFALWNHYYDLLSGDALQNLRQLAASPQLREYVTQTLGHGNLRERIIAATTAGHLGDPAAGAALRKLADHDSPTLSLAAAKSLIEIGADEHLPWLLPRIAERVDWPLAGLATVLRGTGAGAFGALLGQAVLDAAAGSHDSPRLARLLRLTEIAHRGHVMPAVRTLLDGSAALHPEILCACLRLIDDPVDAHHARRLLAHGEWIVRLCAVNALKRAGGGDDRGAIAALLNDEHWWVRYRAAQALAALPGGGRAALEQLRAMHTDHYARDMLGYVAAELGLQ